MTARAAVPEGQLTYDLEGPPEGPPLVLVSGLGGLAAFFEGFASTARSAGFRTLRYDHRGVGRSSPLDGSTSISAMAGDLLAVLDHAAIPKASVLGHSTGGAIAQYLAAHHPDRVDRLVLSATFARPDGYMRRLFESRIAVLAAMGVPAYRAQSALLLYPPEWISAHDAGLPPPPEPSDRGDAAEAATITSRINAILGHDATPWLSRIRAPSLVLVADDDRVTPPALSRDLAERIDGAAFASLPHGGHYVVQTEAAAYAEAVLYFLCDEGP